MLGSHLPDRGDRAARPHAEELEKAIDEELRGSPDEAARRARGRARAQHDRNAASSAARALGGFGGVADRLNTLQPLSRHAGLPAEGHRALPRGHACDAADVRSRISSQPIGACGRARRAGQPELGCAGADAGAAPRRQPARAPSRSTPTSRGATRRPRPAPARPLQVPTPASETAAERADGDPQRAAGTADCRGEPRDQNRQRRQSRSTSRGWPTSPRRCSTRARRRATRCRSPTRSRSSARRSAPTARWTRRHVDTRDR